MYYLCANEHNIGRSVSYIAPQWFFSYKPVPAPENITMADQRGLLSLLSLTVAILAVLWYSRLPSVVHRPQQLSSHCMQLLSDVDMNSQLIESLPTASLLLLLGNLGNPTSPDYSAALDTAAQKFDTVLLLAGDGEYSSVSPSLSMQAINRKLQSSALRHSNLFFLNNAAVKINKTVFIGSTLWFYHEQRLLQRDSRMQLQQRDGSVRNATLADIRDWHNAAIDFLLNALDMIADGEQAVILTHYAPSVNSGGDSIYEAQNVFSKDLSALLKLNRDVLKLWAFGHSKQPMKKRVQGVLLVTYPGCNDNSTVCLS